MGERNGTEWSCGIVERLPDKRGTDIEKDDEDDDGYGEAKERLETAHSELEDIEHVSEDRAYEILPEQ